MVLELDVREALVRQGVDEDAIERISDSGPAALRQLLVEVMLLGEAPRYTPVEAWERAGAPEPLARDLWRAMGFAQLPDDAVALTEADVEALRGVCRLLESEAIPADIVVRSARLFGQTLGRVAETLDAQLRQRAKSLVEQGISLDDLVLMAQETLQPTVEGQLLYIFRRHQVEAARRAMSYGDEPVRELTVGFADVVQFTRLSGELDGTELAELLEVFEAETNAVISERGGRVVKLIGDSVMFTIEEPAEAARIALLLVDRFGGDRPDLRVGLARGPVLSHQGDVFGPTVNMASRLEGYARPGTVLADGSMREELDAAPDLFTKRLRADLKGLGKVEVVVVRRFDPELA